jgi:hypothetical protein
MMDEAHLEQWLHRQGADAEWQAFTGRLHDLVLEHRVSLRVVRQMLTTLRPMLLTEEWEVFSAARMDLNDFFDDAMMAGLIPQACIDGIEDAIHDWMHVLDHLGYRLR